MYKKVENSPGYVRDTSTKAIINIDNSGLDAYRAQRDYTRSQNESLNEMSNYINNMSLEIQNIKQNAVGILTEDISDIKQEMQYIKIMLAKILDK
tara:strand:- start:665 stop:949 length:285 start_codon:yes stop_codon:yes gene_type:complete